MFNWLHKDKNQTEIDVGELITINASKALLSDMAIEKAAGMIAKAIAKSEFKVIRKGQETKDEIYWMLNIKPNENETATEFWIRAIRQLFITNECLIIRMGKGIYRVSNFEVNKSVLTERIYSDVEIEVKGDRYKLQRTFLASDVIHLRNTNKKASLFLKKNLALYNDIANGLLTTKKITSVPKMSLDIETAVPVINTKDKDGNVKKLTIDDYKSKIKEMLESENIEIITNQNGLKVSQLPINSNVNTEDITKIQHEIFTEASYAYDIPKAVFLGEITEKADSTNEFITYAVNWVAEMIEESLNVALVGKEAYLNKGEKIIIDLSKFKHIDLIECADKLDKLRAIGFNLDEIFELVGREPVKTEFSQTRALTKNYMNEGEGGEDNA